MLIAAAEGAEPMHRSRQQLIEEALLDYIERYGLTEKARALYCPPRRQPSPTISQASPRNEKKPPPK